MQKQNLALAVATAALLAASPALAQTTGQGQMQPGETIEALPPAPGADTQDQPAGSAVQTQQETETDVEIVEEEVETDAEMAGEEIEEGLETAGEEVETDVEAVETEMETDAEVVEAEPAMTGEDELEIQGGFVVAQRETNIMGSDLLDASVMTMADESLGSVNDVLMDGEGRTLAVVVGVGGFLGIGEKDVAIPVSSVQLVFEQERGPDGSALPPTGEVEEPLSTGAGGEIAYLLVDFTRDQLEEAPEFERWVPEPMATGTTPPGSVGGMGTQNEGMGTLGGGQPAQPMGAPPPQ